MIEKHLNNYVKRILQFQCPFTLKNGGYNRFLKDIQADIWFRYYAPFIYIV
jgi:hypothetical protein